MTLILGVILPVVMFLATLPLKATVALVKAQLVALQAVAKKSNVAEKLGLEDESKAVKETAKTAVKAGVGTVNLGIKSIKLGVKSVKVLIKSLIFLIKALMFLIHLLQALASFLIFLVTTFGLVFIFIMILLLILLSGMAVIGNNIDFSSSSGASNQVVTSQVSGSSAPSANAQEWLQKCEEMGNWYVNNVSTYGGGSTNCDILGGKKVRTDCSGYIGACLGLAGFIDYKGTDSIGDSGSYCIGGSSCKKLEGLGWKAYDSSVDGFVWKAGDIAARDGHVELVVKTEGDTLWHFGWGAVQSSYPKTNTTTVTGFKHSNGKYTTCLRLE